MTAPAWWRLDGDTLVLQVRVLARSGRDEVVGAEGDRLKVRVAAPPVGGAANQALVSLLARDLGVPRSSVSILAGQGARQKRVAVHSPRSRPPWLPPEAAGVVPGIPRGAAGSG